MRSLASWAACGLSGCLQASVPPTPSYQPFTAPNQLLGTPAQRPFTAVAANARSLRPAPAFTASAAGFDLQLPGSAVAFSAQDVILGSGIHVQTSGWGRSDRMTPVERRRPTPDGRRLVLGAPGITEWWRPLRDGVEQGWTIDARPAGAGPLVIDVLVTGSVSADGANLVLTDPAATSWTVSGLRCWDAEGHLLPCAFSATATGFRVSVDDAGASYPVEIDPVYREPDASLEQSTFGFGIVAVGEGDVNGDGYDDVMVADDGYPGLEDGGHAWVYLGAPSGQLQPLPVLSGLEMSEAYHAALAFADVNGDGYDDVVAGADAYDEALVFMGPDLTLTARLQSDCDTPFGYSVAGVGDVNGDGFDDVVVGSPESYPPEGSTTNGHGPGCVALYLGSPGGLSGSADAVLRGVEAHDSHFGFVVAGLGDVNRDGYDDIGVNSDLNGAVFVFLGSPIARPERTSASAWDSGSGVPFSVGPAGDVNGDGFADLIGDGSEGVRVFPGGAYSLGAPVTIPAVVPDGSFGYDTSGAGDVDGDGFDDVLVADGLAARSYLFLGSPTGIGLSPAKTLLCDGQGGDVVAGAGDVDGDGLDDVLVGNGYSQICLFLGSTLAGPGEPDADTSHDTASDSAGSTDTGTGKAGCGRGGCGGSLSGLLVAPLLAVRRRRK